VINLHQAYGVAGIVKITQILRREIVTAMRLVGAATIEDLRPEMVSTLLSTITESWIMFPHRLNVSTGSQDW